MVNEMDTGEIQRDEGKRKIFRHRKQTFVTVTEFIDCCGICLLLLSPQLGPTTTRSLPRRRGSTTLLTFGSPDTPLQPLADTPSTPVQLPVNPLVSHTLPY